MTGKLVSISTILATSVLAVSYGLAGVLIGAPLLSALGLLWLLGQRRGWGWATSVALVLFVGAAALGLWLDVGAGWMLLGAVAALSAWDLDHFAQRMRTVKQIKGARNLERRHLQRLLTVDGLGLLLGGVALGIEIEVGFGTAFLLGLLAILGLSWAIQPIRRESD